MAEFYAVADYPLNRLGAAKTFAALLSQRPAWSRVVNSGRRSGRGVRKDGSPASYVGTCCPDAGFLSDAYQPNAGIANFSVIAIHTNMILEQFPDVQRLSPSEKLIFVTELWNDLEANPSEVPVSREIIEELDRRMEHFRQHPNEFTTWEAVRNRILRAQP